MARWPPATPAISFFHLKLQGYRLAVSFSTHTQVSTGPSYLILPFGVSDVSWWVSKFLVSRQIFLEAFYEQIYIEMTFGKLLFSNVQAEPDSISEAVVA